MTFPEAQTHAQRLPSTGDWETIVERTDQALGHFSLLSDMIVERGNKSDWDLLHDLHYKAENLPIGPKFWKLTLYGQTIGVLVTGNPKGLIKERHMVFKSIKPTGNDTRLTNTQRYRYINQNFRIISRFVIDTMYRGIGAGYMMMNLASRMEGTKFMEIQSSMSKFNHFGQKGGFRFVTPMNASKYEKGLKFFRGHFEASPQDFEAIVNEIAARPQFQRDLITQQCRDFYYQHSALERTGNGRNVGAARVAAMDARTLVKAIQQMTLASPMYGVFLNPDIGTEIPQRLPLTAFRWQKPTEKLKVPEGFAL